MTYSRARCPNFPFSLGNRLFHQPYKYTNHPFNHKTATTMAEANHLNSVYRFYPTEEELVSFYLLNKLQNQRTQAINRVIPVVHVYQHNPSHLPQLAGEVCRRDTEQWFFFVPRQEREAHGGRPSRTTASGYWKATGSPTYVYSSENKVIGVKKTMVFYEGKSRSVKKTKWKMNEYRAIKEDAHDSNALPVPRLQHELSLCRVYVVSGTTRAFDRRPLGIESMGLVNTETSASSSRNTQTQTQTSRNESSSRNTPQMYDPTTSYSYLDHEMFDITDNATLGFSEQEWQSFVS